jgi:hypothetical protein
VLGLLEAEGHAVKDADLGVRRLDERVRQVVDQGGLDAGAVLEDRPAEVDEGRDPTSTGPREPGVE